MHLDDNIDIAVFPLKFSELLCIQMEQSKVAKDSNRGLTWTHNETLALIWVWSETLRYKRIFVSAGVNTWVYWEITISDFPEF